MSSSNKVSNPNKKVVKRKTTKSKNTKSSKTVDNTEFESKNTDKQNVYVNDYREILNNYNIKNNKSPKVITDYELAVLIGNRAQQLALNAPPLIDNIEGMSYVEIAEEELKQKKSPFIFCRIIGNREEYYKLEDIEVNL